MHMLFDDFLEIGCTGDALRRSAAAWLEIPNDNMPKCKADIIDS